MPTSWAPRQLLTGWVAHPRPIGYPEMSFGRTLKKALKCNDLPTDAQPSDAQPSDAQPAPCQPQRLSPRLWEPAQYVKTRAANRAARYAARTNRANAPPQQHHLAQGIALDNLIR
jgi:hypothetical protein